MKNPLNPLIIIKCNISKHKILITLSLIIIVKKINTNKLIPSKTTLTIKILVINRINIKRFNPHLKETLTLIILSINNQIYLKIAHLILIKIFQILTIILQHCIINIKIKLKHP